MPISPNVASLLREARRKSGLSQRDLASKVHTAQSVVGRIEASLTSPSFDTIARLLDAAGFELKIELLPKPFSDPVIEAYKRDVDRTLLRQNLRRTVDERLQMNVEMLIAGIEMRRAMRAAEDS